jgi:undecaprenyl-diphosphatase
MFSSKILGIEQTEFVKLFEVFIQAGAILSVVILYAKELIQNMKLSFKVFVAFLPTALIGLLLHKIIKNVFFESDWLMLTVFFIVGLIFLLVEYLIKKEKIRIDLDISKIDYKTAIFIGLFQSLAVVPGVSRAGAVIIGMMLLRFKRDDAAKFSFMLSIPTIFAASFLDLFQSREILLSQSDNFILLTIGFVTAFLSSLIIVKWFIKFLQRNTLNLFGWYRIVAVVFFLF